MILFSQEHSDAQFCRVFSEHDQKELQKVYACGSINVKLKQSSQMRSVGYNLIEMELLDLDAPTSSMIQRKKKFITC
jgi:hypothetical protein